VLDSRTSMWFLSHASSWKLVLSVDVLFGQMDCSFLARDRLKAARLNDLAGKGRAPEDPLRNTNCGAKVAGGILATQSFPKPISGSSACALFHQRSPGESSSQRYLDARAGQGVAWPRTCIAGTP
jgi:hypothetical protein